MKITEKEIEELATKFDLTVAVVKCLSLIVDSMSALTNECRTIGYNDIEEDEIEEVKLSEIEEVESKIAETKKDIKNLKNKIAATDKEIQEILDII